MSNYWELDNAACSAKGSKALPTYWAVAKGRYAEGDASVICSAEEAVMLETTGLKLRTRRAAGCKRTVLRGYSLTRKMVYCFGALLNSRMRFLRCTLPFMGTSKSRPNRIE